MSDIELVTIFDEKQCRCCLKSAGAHREQLFEGAEAPHLRHMLLACTGLEIEVELGLPQDICELCTSRLREAFKFRQQCQESEASLRRVHFDVKSEVDFLDSPDVCDSFDEKKSYEDYLPLQYIKSVDTLQPKKKLKKNANVKVKKKKKRTHVEKLAKKLKKLSKLKANLGNELKNGSTVLPYVTQLNEPVINVDIKLENGEDKSIIKHESNLIDNPEKIITKSYCNSDVKEVTKTKSRAKGLFFCDICGHSVKVKWDLIAHFRRHTGEKPYKCETCGKNFAYDGALKTHQKLHTGSKNFICDICGKALSTKDTLAAHRRLHTGELPFTCTVCGRSFRALTNLRAHRKIHTGDKRHSCPVCNKLFYTKSDMRDHARRHTGERPFACSLCPQRFTGKSNFRLHMKIHAGQKDFECPDCPKTFVSKDSLRRHSRTHSGEKAFECIECGRRFAHRSSLVSHQAIHSKTKDYVCDICSQRFAYASGLYVHRKKKHNIQSSRLIAPIL